MSDPDDQEDQDEPQIITAVVNLELPPFEMPFPDGQ